MALSLIGAGFGRTGTMSMKAALEELGLGPCHHMKEVIGNPAQLSLWREAAQGNLPDWDKAFEGFRSAIDWPSANYWRELSAFYPDAKVLLTVRSPESWYDSFSETILKTIGPNNDPQSFGVRAIRNQIFGGRPEDRDHAIAVYKEHNARVQATIPQGRLLTYAIGDGWEPLCRFLGKDVPATPFPRSNSTEEFRAVVLQK